MQAPTFLKNQLSVDSEQEGFQNSLRAFLPRLSVPGSHISMVFESLLEMLFPSQGFLLLDETGQLIESTSKARELCYSIEAAFLDRTEQQSSYSENSISLPCKVVELCVFLINSRVKFPDRALQLSDEIFEKNGLRVHLDAEWIAISEQSSTFILVRLEDTVQIAGQRAICDAARYEFTARETEVWNLYLQGLSYREIGEQLFIAVCTVKKHMKSINGKRRGEIF